MTDDSWFERLAHAAAEDRSGERAPARLKSRIYSALVQRMAADGPLLSLATTKSEGRKLCVFEDALLLLPTGDELGVRNPCRICHARVLGERMDHAPIFWPGCPYAKFHRE